MRGIGSKAALFFFLHLALGSSVPPLPALANIPDDLGLGFRATAMGGAFTAVADDYSAAWYNPAGLSQVARANLSIETLYAMPDLGLSGRGAASMRDRFQTPAEDMDDSSGLALGMVLNLGWLVGLDRLSLGLASYIPFAHLELTPVTPEPQRDPHFVRYADRLQVVSFLAGLSYQVHPSLSLGVGGNMGVTFAPNNLGFVDVTLFPGEGEVFAYEPSAQGDQRVGYLVAPSAGLLWKPFEQWRLGLAWRAESKITATGAQDIKLILRGPGGEMIYQLTAMMPNPYVNFFIPMSLAGGASYHPSDSLTLAADLTWSKWSAFEDGKGNRPGPRFEDTWTPRLGAEYRLTPDAQVSAGYFFEPSPVPPQRGESNYLDPDKHAFSLGCGFTFRDLLPFWRRPLTLGAYIQYIWLPSVEVDKTDEHLHGEDYSASGSVVNVGGGLVLHY